MRTGSILAGLTASAMLVAGLPAEGADIPGSVKTKAALKVVSGDFPSTTGVFEQAEDSDWYRVKLTKGRDYYVTVNGSDGTYLIVANLRDSRGKVLGTADDGDPDSEYGFELRAPYSGTYYVEYRLTAGFPGTSSYLARIAQDCARGSRTLCSLPVGKSHKSLIGSTNDNDWYRLSLKAGQTYTVTAAKSGGCRAGSGSIAIADASGKALTEPKVFAGGEGEPFEIRSFRPPRNGTYYLIVKGDDDCGPGYRVSLTTP